MFLAIIPTHMPYIEVQQGRGGFNYWMSGSYKVGQEIQGSLNGNSTTIRVEAARALGIMEDGRVKKTIVAVLLDGPNIFRPHRVLTPINREEFDNLMFLRNPGIRFSPWERHLSRRQADQSLRQYFAEGLYWAGVKLPEPRLADKVWGFTMSLFTGDYDY